MAAEGEWLFALCTAAHHAIDPEQQQRADNRKNPAAVWLEIASVRVGLEDQIADDAAKDAAADAEQRRHQTAHRVTARHNQARQRADDQTEYQPADNVAY